MADELNKSLDDASKKLNDILATINKIVSGLGIAAGAASKFSGNFQFGGGGFHQDNGHGLGLGAFSNVPSDDLTKFSGILSKASFGLNIAGTVAQGVGQMANGAMKGMPGVQEVLQYSRGYYGASIAMGGMNRKLMQQATFGGMQQGMTSVGADAQVAALLAGRGMSFSSARGSTYMQTVNTAGNLAKYLNMDVTQAASAVESMTNAGGASNMLRTFGIYTSDLATGKEKTMPQIFEELAQRLTIGPTTAEGTMRSLRKGALGASIRNSGLSEDQQALFSQYMIDRAAGKSTDWVNDKALGNDNPLSSTYQLNASQTKQYGKAEDKYIQGIRDMVPVISTLNDAFGNLAATVGNLNSAYQTYQGSNAGQGTNGVMKGALPLIGTVAGAILGGGPLGAVVGGTIGTGLAAMIPGGGERTNYGSMGRNAARSSSASMSVGSGGYSFEPMGNSASTASTKTGVSASSSSKTLGKAAQSFTPPTASGIVSARLGQLGQYWDKNAGHRGTDFVASSGSAVLAIGDGVVIAVDSGGELGNQVKIKHENGFVSHYCHLSSAAVSYNDTVKQGKTIAAAGNTGTNSHGAHLHFVLYKGNKSVDPFKYIPGLKDQSGAQGFGTAAGSSVAGADTAVDGSMSTGSGAATEGGFTPGTYGSTSTLVTGGGFSGITTSDNSATATIGAGGDRMPEALNGSRFNNRSNGGYKTNAPSAKTGVDYVPNDGTYNLHQGESVLTAQETATWRSLKNGSMGGKGTEVTINVNVARATEEEAVRLANKVKQLLKDDRHLAKIGRG
jgi:hypothetical protein